MDRITWYRRGKRTGAVAGMVTVGLLALLPLAGCGQEIQGALGRAGSNLTAPADTQAGEVNFKLAGPGGAALVVPVTVNGQGPFNFVLDTGATITVIDQETARRLKLQNRRGAVAVGAGVGGSGRVRLVGVKSVKVGTAQATDLTAAVLDLRHTRAVGVDIDGLIGLNFLKSYKVTLDFQRKTVTLQKP